MDTKKKICCLGPFVEIEVGVRRTAFTVPPGSLVPLRTVHLDNSRIYAIYNLDSKYYVVYETDNLDFYKPYLAPLPAAGKKIDALKLPRCPQCGSTDIIESGDEMYCRKCDIEFWHYGVVWEPKPFDPSLVLQGAGVYVVENAVWEYTTAAGGCVVREVLPIASREEKLGNVECTVETFYGYVYSSSYDEKPSASKVAVYERITPKSFKLRVTRFVRELEGDDEVERIVAVLAQQRGRLALEAMLRAVPPEKAREFVKRYGLHEQLYWSELEPFADEEIRARYVERRLRDLEREVSEALATLQDEGAILYPGIAVGIVEELEKLGVQDPRLAELKAKLNYFFEEQEKKKKRIKQREEEKRKQRRQKLEEVKRKLEEELHGLPVRITMTNYEVRVELTKRVSRERFQRYIETCKKHGMRFDGRGWVFSV